MRMINVIGKLKAGVSVERARAELEAVRSRTKTANPNIRLPPTLRITPLKEKIVGGATRPLIVLLAAAGFVFLIACANVAHLFLARASSRRGEVAIRAAIGAGRWRLARQFFVESALIAAAGAFAGLVVARWSLATIVRVFPHAVPRLQETTIDGRALAFAAAATIMAALVFGMVPVWSLWKDDARGVLKQALSGALPIAGKLRTENGSRRARVRVDDRVADRRGPPDQEPVAPHRVPRRLSPGSDRHDGRSGSSGRPIERTARGAHTPPRRFGACRPCRVFAPQR